MFQDGDWKPFYLNLFNSRVKVRKKDIMDICLFSIPVEIILIKSQREYFHLKPKAKSR